MRRGCDIGTAIVAICLRSPATNSSSAHGASPRGALLWGALIREILRTYCVWGI